MVLRLLNRDECFLEKLGYACRSFLMLVGIKIKTYLVPGKSSRWK